MTAAPLKILVTGGRDYYDWRTFYYCMDLILANYEVESICQGAAAGADHMAVEWAYERGIRCCSFPARWDEHGRAAGMIRNRRMLEEYKPNVVVACPGGRGTANMTKIAIAAGITIWYIKSSGS